jgi:hypothetical protein
MAVTGKSWRKFSSMLLLSLLGLQLAIELGAEAKEPEWILNVQQRDLNSFTIVVSHDAAKVSCDSLGFTLVCKAPDWRVVTFNPSQKTICSCRLEDFRAPMLTNPLGGGWAPTGTVQRKLHVDVMGHGKLDGLGYSFGVLEDTKKRYEVWQSDTIDVAPQCVEVLCRLIEIPVIDGIPLFVHPVHRGGKLKREQLLSVGAHLDTESDAAIPVVVRTLNWKTTPFKAQDFDVPTNFRKVKQMTEVTFSRQMKNNLTDIMNDVGFSAPQRSDGAK